jgi:hypothetical protein
MCYDCRVKADEHAEEVKRLQAKQVRRHARPV